MKEYRSSEKLIAALKENNVRPMAVAERLGISRPAATGLFQGSRRLLYDEAVKLIPLVAAPPSREIPVIGMAGAGAWIEAVEETKETVSVPYALAAELEGIFAVEVSGDSMNMILPEGAFAVIDPAQTDLYSGKMYLLRNGGGEATIKRYRSDPARFEPVSDNPEYVPFVLGMTDFSVIGRVTGSIVKF